VPLRRNIITIFTRPLDSKAQWPDSHTGSSLFPLQCQASPLFEVVPVFIPTQDQGSFLLSPSDRTVPSSFLLLAVWISGRSLPPIFTCPAGCLLAIGLSFRFSYRDFNWHTGSPSYGLCHRSSPATSSRRPYFWRLSLVPPLSMTLCLAIERWAPIARSFEQSGR